MSTIDWHERLREDRRTTEELVQAALSETDGDLAWFAVAVLHFRSTREVLETAKRLSVSSKPKERQLGADILGQFGCAEKQPYPYFEETVERLLSMLRGEEDPGVLNSIAVGLGHRSDPRSVEPLSQLSSHPSSEVRIGVVHGLKGLSDPLSVQTLIRLTRDPESDVRDWATFSLGQFLPIDSPEVREALWQRTNDEDDMTRIEALSGLALRHDSRIIPRLIEELHQPEVYRVAIEAAGELGSPQLLGPLLELREECEWSDEYGTAIEEAIAKCECTSD